MRTSRIFFIKARKCKNKFNHSVAYNSLIDNRNLGNEYYPTIMKEKVRKSRKSQNPPSKIATGMLCNCESLFQKMEYLSRSCFGKLNNKRPSHPIGKKQITEEIPFSQAVLTDHILMLYQIISF